MMLVDDSAVIRGSLARIFENKPDIKIVSSVSNGEMAVSAVEIFHPHVIIMDIEMPVMDGITALGKIMEKHPEIKVIMFSTLTSKGADISIRALSMGAVECIVKPDSSQSIGDGSIFQQKLLGTIRGLVPEEIRRAPNTDVRHRPVLKPAVKTPVTLHDDKHSYQGKPRLLAIGSSTGGPQALFEVLKNFKGFDIPIVITQHMPAKFTTILAEHIAQHSGVPSHEGADGMILEAGHIYVAPGGFHMLFEQNSFAQTVIKLDEGPPVNFCKPAVDPMFESALKIYKERILALILTGMGADGLKGAQAIVERGGRLITQDEETSVVWGMPGAVAKAGICSQILPLKEIGPWARQAVMG